MTQHRVRIVATDGDYTRTVAFIRCDPDNEYVYGTCDTISGDPSTKITYHNDGYVHHKPYRSGPLDVRPICYGPPIRDFTGFFSGNVVSSIPRTLDGLQPPTFEDDARPIDHITYIDTRGSDVSLCYQWIMCEPGFPVGDLVSRATGRVDKNAQVSYHIYTAVDPWVGVIYGPGFRPEFLPPYSSGFRPMGEAVRIRSERSPYPEPCVSGSRGCDGPDGTGPLCGGCKKIYERS